MRLPLIRSAVVSALAVLTGVLLLPVPSALAAGSTPALQAGAPQLRGMAFSVAASGLTSGESYTLTTDGGRFENSDTTSLVFSATDTGYRKTQIIGTENVAAGRSGFTVQLTATDRPDTVLTTAAETLLAPSLSGGSVCPGASSAISVAGLADGSYTFSSSSVSFTPSVVSASSGRASTTASSTAVPADATATLRSVDDPAVSYTWPIARQTPVLALPDQPQYSAWQLRYTAGCFTPGESVGPVNHAVNSTGVRSVADAHGVARIRVDLHPAVQARSADPVVFRGASSGQTVTVAGAGVLGTTLSQGQSLISTVSDPWQRGRFLAAASSDTSANGRPNFIFSGGCNPGLFVIYPHVGETSAWQAFPGRFVPGACRTVLGSGDLYVQNAAGRIIWRSGTHGTRTGNRLVVFSSQLAEIITGTQAVIWRTDVREVSTPLSAMLRPVGALHRGQSVGWGTVRFGLDRRGNVVVTRAGKVVLVRHTAGMGGIRLRMLDNGDVVLRTAHHRTVWSTGTHSANASLEVTATGDVGIFSARGHHLVWHTGTGL